MSDAMSFDELRDLYQEVILDHGRRPRNHRRLETFDATAKGDNPMCGDRCQVWVHHGEGGKLDDIGFQARGCAISVASGSLMTDAVRGLTDVEVRRLAEAVREMARTGRHDDPALEPLAPLAGVHEYPSRVKCATLPWHALVAALDGHGDATSE